MLSFFLVFEVAKEKHKFCIFTFLMDGKKRPHRLSITKPQTLSIDFVLDKYRVHKCKMEMNEKLMTASQTSGELKVK